MWLRKGGKLTRFTAEEARENVGKRGVVCGEVAQVYAEGPPETTPVMLHLDRPYPDIVFSLMVMAEDRGKLPGLDETMTGKRICATGLIAEYQGTIHMRIKNAGQIADDTGP